MTTYINATNTGNLYSAGNGKVLIGQTTGEAIPANITAGTGVTITNGTNSISIASNGASVVVDQTSGSVTCAVNTVYITDNGASLVTYTLPTTAALGDFIEIVGKSSGLWTIVYSTGQSIVYGAVTTTTTSGSLSAVLAGDSLRLRCTTANTVFTVVSSIGNIAYA